MVNIDKEIFKALNLDSFTDRPLEDDEVVLVFMGTMRKAWKARAALDEQRSGNVVQEFIDATDALLESQERKTWTPGYVKEMTLGERTAVTARWREARAALDGTFISEGTKIRESGAALDEQDAKDAARYRLVRNSVKAIHEGLYYLELPPDQNVGHGEYLDDDLDKFLEN